ncbi:hypothetical protein KO495_00125 [Colwellia sp. D2M02]|uniref:hypothetical protein n=1 Tax=Colwellia sp. D2M02 TaxID=2841562 RepID=UPI001C09FEB3|nr:hypothetical protein [Colwellia sp. D2M02]MBU2891722.1 hypothetical protein [Colwellia sp. D2M02]
MTITIAIKHIVFKCKTDEQIFYERLAKTTGLTKITLHGEVIYIFVACEYQHSAIEELTALCDMWHGTYAVMPNIV